MCCAARTSRTPARRPLRLALEGTPSTPPHALAPAGLYFWEGVKYIYTDPQLTKRVGRMFGGKTIRASCAVRSSLAACDRTMLQQLTQAARMPMRAARRVLRDPEQPLRLCAPGENC